MVYGVTRNWNHQIWTLFDLFVDFRSLLEKEKEKEKEKGLNLIIRAGRGLAPEPTGPAQLLGTPACSGECDASSEVLHGRAGGLT